MAGMKETPRQKMIGMMYLVLTALLALQVSDALIQKFILLNNSMEVSNASSNQNNNGVVDAIKKKVADSPNPSEYADIIKKADEVRKITGALVAEIDGIKAKVIEAGGGIDPETGTIANPKEEEKVYEQMVGPSKNGLAYGLKTKLDQYIVEVAKFTEKKKTEIKPLALGAEEDPIVNKDPNQKGKDFAELNFAQTPVPAALATLSQKQSEIRRYESLVLGELAEKVGIKDIKFDKVFAMVSAKSNTVVAGSTYEAEMFLAASSSGITPRMSFNGTGVAVTDGKGQIKFRAEPGGGYDANGLSKRTYNAVISFEGPEGPKTVNVEKEYFVAKPTYNIETATLPGMYLGCANKLSIVSPGLGPLWQPSFSGDGGDVIPEGGKGKVTIIPNAAAFTLNISNNGSLIGKENFKVRTVPRPELRLYVNGAEADEKRGISAGQARTVEVKCFSDENFKTTNPEDARFRPTGVKIFLARGTSPKGSVEGGAGAINVNSLATNAQSGDRFVIEVKGVQRMNFRGAVSDIPMSRTFQMPLN